MRNEPNVLEASKIRLAAKPAAWYGAELIAKEQDWQWQLSNAEIAALRTAVTAARVQALHPPFPSGGLFTQPELMPMFSWIALQLSQGPGFVRICGCPTEMPADDLKRLFWGLCATLGDPLHQTVSGEFLGEIRDETGTGTPLAYQKSGETSSRNISRSTAALRFHTDRCDVLSLFCTSSPAIGGDTKILSSLALRNEIARRRPDFLRILEGPFWNLRALSDDETNEIPAFALPVFAHAPNGDFTSQFSRSSIVQAQDIPSVPRLSPAQYEAMDLIAEIGDEICLQASFKAGDMQFMNQHITYHGRAAYADDPAENADRILLRIWLSTPFSPALPAGHEVQWGNIAAGSLRGGALPGHGVL
jgi:hypothetical protein